MTPITSPTTKNPRTLPNLSVNPSPPPANIRIIRKSRQRGVYSRTMLSAWERGGTGLPFANSWIRPCPPPANIRTPRIIRKSRQRGVYSRTILSNSGPRVTSIVPKPDSCATSTARSFFSTSNVWNFAATCFRRLRATSSSKTTDFRGLPSDFWIAWSSWPERRFRMRASSSFSPSYINNQLR